MTNDGGSHSYTYDAENRISEVGSSLTYSYDGDGKRVHKSGGLMYWYGTGSSPLLETSSTGSLTYEYIFFNGQRIARRDSSNNVYYYYSDHLGSARVVINSPGTSAETCFYYPYGVEMSGPCFPTSGNTYKFTGKERDGTQTSETGLDDFGARHYASYFGRFMTPDPFNAGADLINPQSWNMYSYALNNPLKNIDPTGLYCVDDNNDELVDENGDEIFSSEQECNGYGSWVTVDGQNNFQQQLTVTADDDTSDDDTSDADTEGLGGGSLPQTPGSACTVARIASATKGVLNLGVGAAKIGLAALSGASTPATGPLGGVGAAYLGIGAAGNISAGAIQLIGAITGNVNGTGQAATAATTATSVLGLGALLATGGNLQTASNWANIESLGTAGLNGGMTGHLVDQAATFAQKLFLSAELGQNAADAVGLNTGGTCH